MTKQQNTTMQKSDVSRKRTTQPTQDGVSRQPNEFVNLGAIQAGMLNPADASRKVMRGAQRAYGNSHVRRSVQNQRVQRAMTVNDPNDQYEQEAEAVADSLHRKPSISADSTPPPADGGSDDSVTQRKSSERVTASPHNGKSATPLQQVGKTTNTPPVQRAMKVNDPNDQYEQEAEAVADTLHRSPEHVPPVGGDGGGTGSGGDEGNSADVQRHMSADVLLNGAINAQAQTVRRMVPNKLSGALFQSTTTSDVQKVEAGEEEDAVMTSPANPQFVPPFATQNNAGAVQRNELGMDADGAVHANVENQIDRKRGSGAPLPAPVQSQMEGHLGNDFSNVRVHNDSHSDSLNRSLQAEAFTTGNDVFFSRGSYNPGSQGGQKLIAHELTHVVQQGASQPLSAQRKAQIQRETMPEEEIGRRESAETPRAEVSIQRSKEDFTQADIDSEVGSLKGDEKKNATAALSDGGSKMRDEKSAGASKESEKEGAADGSPEVKSGKSARKPIIPKDPPLKKPEKPDDVREKVTASDLEDNAPEANFEQPDTGNWGWPATKDSNLPDWDDEVKKFEAFRKGDYSETGIDLSNTEGDFMGLNEKITVDDPQIRANIVADALSVDTGDVAKSQGMNFAKNQITKRMPVLGQVGNAIELTEKMADMSPGEWWSSTKEGFKKGFSEGMSAFKGMFEGSFFNRAASAVELVIAVLDIAVQVLRFLMVITNVVFLLSKLLYEIGKKLRWLGIGYPMMWLGKIGMTIGMALNAPQLLAITIISGIQDQLRGIAIAFRTIDILYYETDPEKLLERQKKLSGHAKALTNSIADNIVTDPQAPDAKDKSKEKAKNPAEGETDDATIVDPDGQREELSEEQEKAQEARNEKAAWAEKYGIDTTASQIRDKLGSADFEAPPIAEYKGDKEADVVSRVDQAAVAIVQLQREQYGLAEQRQEISTTVETAQNQAQVMGEARVQVAANQEAVEKHQDDIELKKEKQTEMTAKSQETQKEGEKTKGKGSQLSGVGKIIMALMKPFMPAVKKVGKKIPEEKQKETEEGGKKTEKTGEQTMEEALNAQNIADERNLETKRAESESKESAATLEKTDDLLATKQDEVQAGIEEMQALQDEIQSEEEMMESEKQRLMTERIAAINDAVDWMAQWREARKNLFEEVEEKLEKRQEEEKEADEDDESEADPGMTDIWDAQEDQGNLKGTYIDEDMQVEGVEDEAGELELE